MAKYLIPERILACFFSLIFVVSPSIANCIVWAGLVLFVSVSRKKEKVRSIALPMIPGGMSGGRDGRLIPKGSAVLGYCLQTGCVG